jgi:hypothetical protein
MTTYYRRNSNGRYERVGEGFVQVLPDGLHLVYVHSTPGRVSKLSTYNIDLDQVNQEGCVLINKDEATKIVMEALEFKPGAQLTKEEQAIWDNFRESKVGQKICNCLTRQSASDAAQEILKRLLSHGK